MYSMRQILTCSLAARLGLLLYGIWQDANMAVKFTDVDYHVFSDAAHLVSQGQSPYLRPTYRYTPLLAWVLYLNQWLSPHFGKCIFIVFDILVGHTIYHLLMAMGYNHSTARNWSLLWLCNPLAATVSSRGNAESVMAYLVLACLYQLINRNTVWAAVLYALSIHVKIYPVTYALPIYLYLGTNNKSKDLQSRKGAERMYCVKSVIYQLLPNKERLVFGVVAATVLGLLTLFFYFMYGWTFLYETYLYHLVRGDIRHNFSPYFYLLYLTSDPQHGVPLCLRLLVFLPQLLLLLAVSAKFYRDQPLSWFLCTYVFVMANKVCTSQYFLWYLSLLPVVGPQLRFSLKSGLAALTLWFVGQGVWLYPAYLLEFEGSNTYLFLWIAGLVFYIINAAIVFIVIRYSASSNVKNSSPCSHTKHSALYSNDKKTS